MQSVNPSGMSQKLAPQTAGSHRSDPLQLRTMTSRTDPRPEASSETVWISAAETEPPQQALRRVVSHVKLGDESDGLSRSVCSLRASSPEDPRTVVVLVGSLHRSFQSLCCGEHVKSKPRSISACKKQTKKQHHVCCG